MSNDFLDLASIEKEQAEQVARERAATKPLRYLRAEISGGGGEFHELTAQARENPAAAAMEVIELRGEIAAARAALHPTPRHDMLALAKSFPILREHVKGAKLGPDAPRRSGHPQRATAAEDGENLLHHLYARIDHMSPAGRHAVLFLNMVWNGCTGWEKELGVKSYSFDVYDALASWDDRQRAAFTAWVQEPWFM